MLNCSRDTRQPSFKPTSRPIKLAFLKAVKRITTLTGTKLSISTKSTPKLNLKKMYMKVLAFLNWFPKLLMDTTERYFLTVKQVRARRLLWKVRHQSLALYYEESKNCFRKYTNLNHKPSARSMCPCRFTKFTMKKCTISSTLTPMFSAKKVTKGLGSDGPKKNSL